MNQREDPSRLFEAKETPAELRAWLRRAQQDVFSPAEEDQLIRSVETRMLAPTAAVPEFRRLHSRATVKVVAGLLVVGLGLGSWYMTSRSRSSGPTVTDLPPARLQVTCAPAPLPEPASVAPAPTPDELAPSPTMAKTPRVAHSRGGERDTVHRTSIATQTPEGRTERPPTDEFALLRAARQAIGDRPARALALTSEHARIFPAGMLAQEREAIAVEALVKLGRASQAQTRARAFLAAHPDSPYKSRIDAALMRVSGVQQSP
jgi:hypothetical protein